MTAEQFLDAVWFVTGTAPAKADTSVHPSREATAPEHRFVRAALVRSDDLMRSLGRPESRAGSHDAQRCADDAGGPRPVERRDLQ